jgi:ribosomal protein S27AE
MSGRTSSVGQRVDLVSVSDEPHEDYREYDPWTGEPIGRYDEEGEVISGLPILKKVQRGTSRAKIIEKEIIQTTMHCDKCGDVVYFDHDEAPVCERCGLICSGREGREIQRERLLYRDAKAAGRIDGGQEC